MIDIVNVSKIYSGKIDHIHAVKDVSLHIDDGEIFGIIGYSGAGKSTLVRIINQLEIQSSGNVIVNGKKMQLLTEGELRRQRQKIGMIFQHFNLMWSRTVYKNIELPLEFAGVEKNNRQEIVNRLIRLVGLEGRENSYPSELSGGQKQRVGIARALANNPDILLCDEATSALDPDTTEQILDLLKKINNELGITIIMITHQMEVVRKICHRVAVMSSGEVVEIGSVKELFENPKHDVTKRFVQNMVSNQTIEELNQQLHEKYPNGKLLRVSFTGNNADLPIISEAIRKVHIPVSIVTSNISQSSIGPIGVTYLHLSDGSDKEYQIFLDKLLEYDLKVEEI